MILKFYSQEGIIAIIFVSFPLHIASFSCFETFSPFLQRVYKGMPSFIFLKTKGQPDCWWKKSQKKKRMKIFIFPTTKEEPALICECVCVCMHSIMSDSLWAHGLEPARRLSPWNFPGKNTGVGSHFLLQRIFPTQESNSCLLCLQCLLHW